MKQFLISGAGSGLGAYFTKHLHSSRGFNRKTFNLVKYEEYDTIIHCAFNKTHNIEDYYGYLEDNIFLTQNLLNLKYNKFVYISSIDVYNENTNMYSLFKRFAESVVEKAPNVLILRCSTLLGETMKPNHAFKIKNNELEISLSEESLFNYIMMEDLTSFLNSGDYKQYNGIIDFVSNTHMKVKDLKQYFNSNTKTGNHIYTSDFNFVNPIYSLDNKYNYSSLDIIKRYFI